MKKYLILISLLVLGFNSYADEIDDLFERGEDMEYQFERFDERNVFTAISHDAGMMCDHGLCRMTSTHTEWNNFSINMGANLGNGGTNTNFNYGGNGSGQGGAIIFTGGNSGGNTGGTTSEDGETPIGWSAHLNMTLNIGQCTRSIKIPRAVFYSINRYMYGLMHDDGTTRRTFTPADEAMILFYSTVMKMASGCGGSSGRH